jgi:type VI secretion system secreted protein Hcp
MAQVDYFLKLDGIAGESTDAKHKGEIELASFSWGAQNSGTAGHGGGGGAGKVTFNDLHFIQRTQKSSSALLLSVATGKHIPAGQLTARKAGKGQIEFLKIKLTDILVTSFQISAADDLPLEQISLNFSKFEFSYSAQDQTGKAVPVPPVRWDLKGNKSF